MDRERLLQIQKNKDIEVMRWVCAMAKIASRILVSEEVDPTHEELTKFFKSISLEERDAIEIAAKLVMKDEFSELCSLAVGWGFDQESARASTKMVLHNRYTKIANSDGLNFNFLDQAIFGHRS